MFTISGYKCAAVVKAEIAGIIIIFCEIDAFLAEDFLKQSKVNRFVVHNDAVEIKDDGSKHGP